MVTRLEQDAEKVLKYLDIESKVRDAVHGERPYRRPRSAINVRDQFHWTLTRSQRAIDLLIEQGRATNVGTSFNLLKPNEKHIVYTVAK